MKKKMLKRVISLVLGAVLVFSMFGCAGNGDSKDTAQGPDSGNTETETKTVTRLPEEEVFAPYDETVTLTAARVGIASNNLPEGEDFETNQYIKWVEEKLNIDLNYTFLATDTETYNTRINLMITTGDLPDIVMVDRSGYLALVEAELLADMTDIITMYSSELISNYYDSYNGSQLEYAKVDGRIYGIPNAKPQDCQQLLWVRKDWREKLGIDKPETMEDVIELARAFVTQDPDGNGQKDTVGLLGDPSLYATGGAFVFNSIFGVKNSTPGQFMKNEAGEVYYGSVQPETKEALQILADMYSEGLIDKEMVTRDWNSNAGLVNTGVAGLFFYPWHGGWMASNTVAVNPDAEWEIFAAPVNDNGEVITIVPEPAMQYLVVNKNCKNPEAVMKLLSVQYQGLRMLDEEAAQIYAGLGVSWENWPFAFELNYRETVYEDAIAIQEAAETGDISGLKASMIPNYQYYINYLEKGPEDMTSYGNAFAFGVSAAMTGDPHFTNREAAYYGITDTMAMKKPNLDRLENETFLRIITGQQPISAFDDFVTKWYKEGGSEILAEVEAAVK